METQQATETPKAPPPQKKDAKEIPNSFTVFELESIKQIVNARGAQGVGVKDIRLLSSLSKRISSFIPAPPEPPKQDANATPEQKKEFTESIKKWQEDLEKRVDIVVTTDFTAQEIMVIKGKVRSFTHFHSDEDVRERLIPLFDKLDIQ